MFFLDSSFTLCMLELDIFNSILVNFLAHSKYASYDRSSN